MQAAINSINRFADSRNVDGFIFLFDFKGIFLMVCKVKSSLYF